MKSEYFTSTQSRELTFPAMYQNTFSELIVLFESLTSGAVVRATDTSSIGHTAKNWHPCNKSEHWTRVPSGAQITLTQE